MRRILVPALAILVASQVLAQGTAPSGTAAPIPAETDDEEGGGRIVGGVEAQPGSAPWQVQIFAKGDAEYTTEEIEGDRNKIPPSESKHLWEKDKWELNHRCGGALIARDWIVTAAHCAVLPPVRAGHDFLAERGVRVGTQDLQSGGATYRIERVVIHKLYDKDKHIHDIALMRIVPDGALPRGARVNARPIRILGSKPTDLPLMANPFVSVTGWGLTGARETSRIRTTDGSLNRMSSRLLEVPLKLLPQSACQAARAEFRVSLIKETLCAGSTDGKDTCQGDSGGPMTRAEGKDAAGRPERVLVGLVSHGYGCGIKGMPGLYANATEYREWIAAAMKSSAAGRVTYQ